MCLLRRPDAPSWPGSGMASRAAAQTRRASGSCPENTTPAHLNDGLGRAGCCRKTSLLKTVDRLGAYHVSRTRETDGQKRDAERAGERVQAYPGHGTVVNGSYCTDLRQDDLVPCACVLARFCVSGLESEPKQTTSRFGTFSSTFSSTSAGI